MYENITAQNEMVYNPLFWGEASVWTSESDSKQRSQRAHHAGINSATKTFSVLPLEAVRRRSNSTLGDLPAHGEPTMRMKPAPPEIGTLALRALVGPPLLLHSAAFKSFLNCTWNGGFP